VKKTAICLALVLLICLASFLVPVFFPDLVIGGLNWGIIAMVVMTLVILASFFKFESAALSSKEIALIAMLGTISAVSRVPFAAIPGVQPCTFFIICTGYVFGPIAGFMVGAETALVSNLFLGQGPWTLYQMFAWGLAGMSAAFMRRFKFGTLSLILFGIIWGYLFGWIMNTWYWVSFIYPLTFKTFLFYQITSVWFDTLHAASNALFLGLFGQKTITILERFAQRFSWSMARK
jgi:energy-coupling factor transport system substrate-specific component